MNDIYYFISDVHLGYGDKESNKKREDILLKFLFNIKDRCKELFIVGDLFDFWIEYKQVVPKGHYRLLNCIYELKESGVNITFLAGNHDFWRGKYFRDEFGINIIQNPVEKTINGLKFYLSHGDGLAYKDTGYKIAKKILRSKISQFCYGLLHPDIGIWLAKKTSAKSRDYTSQKKYSTRDGMLDFAVKKINEGFDFVIMGHRHFPLIKKINSGFYVNLGDWMKNFTYGILENREFKLMQYYDIEKSVFTGGDESIIKIIE